MLVAAALAASSRPSVQSLEYGRTSDGQAVEEFVLRNARGSEARVITYGAILTSLRVPDRHGKLGNVVLGFSGDASPGVMAGTSSAVIGARAAGAVPAAEASPFPDPTGGLAAGLAEPTFAAGFSSLAGAGGGVAGAAGGVAGVSAAGGVAGVSVAGVFGGSAAGAEAPAAGAGVDD